MSVSADFPVQETLRHSILPAITFSMALNDLE